MFQPLKNLLGSALQKKSVRDGIRAAVVIDAAREAIETIFSHEVVARLEPKSFKDGVLTIGVQSPLIAQEVKLRIAALQKLLEERFGEMAIKRIRIEFLKPRQDEQGMIR